MLQRSMKTILVCGGAGFMGSQFIRHLHANYPGYAIVNLDLLTYAGNLDNLRDLEHSARYTFVEGDIGDKLLVAKLCRFYEFDAVVNFAAESHVCRSLINANQFVVTNIQGAYVLLDAVREFQIPRFVHMSTDEVYGDIPVGIRSAEDYPLSPTNPYAASKASADLIIQSYIKTHGSPAILVRSSNNYGPYQYPEKLHSLIITNLLGEQKIPVHGDGSHVRSWLHVDDFCRGMDLILHHGRAQSVYNLAGDERTNLQVIAAIAGCFGRKASDCIDFVPDRLGPDRRYAPDSTKAETELRWTRQHDYDDVIENVVAWYRENRTWWEGIKEKSTFQEHYERQRRGAYSL